MNWDFVGTEYIQHFFDLIGANYKCVITFFIYTYLMDLFYIVLLPEIS